MVCYALNCMLQCKKSRKNKEKKIFLQQNNKKPKATGKGKLVKSKKIDYANIMWPRDALYICYKEEKFEYVQDMEAEGETPYYCDCCDPARQKKRHCSESDSERDDDEEGEAASEDDLEDLEDADKASTTSSSETKSEKTDVTNTPPTIPSKPDQPAKPGWFGKGRRKRARC